jgi:hypothetical protein
MNPLELAIYRCVNPRCRAKGKEFTAMTPAMARLGTGRGVSCIRCGQVAGYVRPLETEGMGK